MTATSSAPDRPEPVDLAWPEERPELLPFLPLVYVAWSDGELSEEELDVLRGRVEAQTWLDEEARDALGAWLRPDRPPTPGSLEGLVERVRALGPASLSGTRRSLVQLGLELAHHHGVSDDGPWSRPEAREALETLEAQLGVVGSEAARQLAADAADGPPEGASREAPTSAAAFDAQTLARFLARPHAELRERVMRLLAEPAFVFPHEIDRDVYRERVLDAVRRLADEGLGGLGYAEEHGGAGDPTAAIAVFETLGFGDLSVLVKFGVQFGLFGGSIQQLGSETHHRKYLEDVAALRLPGCFAMTELDHGSNVRDIETRATWLPEEDAFEIHTPHERAGKHWIGNAARHGHLATVFAQLRVGEEEHGVHALLVPIRDEEGEPLPGVRIADCGAKAGLNGVDNGQLWFDRVRVPRANLLDRFARVDREGRYHSPIPSSGRRFFTMLGTLVAGRISIAAASVSAAKTGLTIAVRYSAARRQFGPSGEREVTILHYLEQQRLLLPRLAATYGLHFAVRDLTARYGDLLERGEASRETVQQEVEVGAAGLKAYASRNCIDTLQACREALGGQGYLAANRFGRLKADTDIFATFEGANVVLLQLVARGLLSEYKQEMGDLKVWDIVRYVADRAQTRVTELNPVQTRRTEPEHLRDPDFLLGALRYREERLLASVARRLKALIDDGVDSFDAMNRTQDHLVALARAHVEREILEALLDAVRRAPNPGVSESLRALAQLWGLERVEQDSGWYLEAGYLEPPKSRAIRREVNALCREIAEDAVALVDGFGIPDDVLRAPDGVRPAGGVA